MNQDNIYIINIIFIMIGALFAYSLLAYSAVLYMTIRECNKYIRLDYVFKEEDEKYLIIENGNIRIYLSKKEEIPFIVNKTSGYCYFPETSQNLFLWFNNPVKSIINRTYKYLYNKYKIYNYHYID